MLRHWLSISLVISSNPSFARCALFKLSGAHCVVADGLSEIGLKLKLLSRGNEPKAPSKLGPHPASQGKQGETCDEQGHEELRSAACNGTVLPEDDAVCA